MSTPKTPRIVMSWIDSDGDVTKEIGSYADGPVGRSDADKVLSKEVHYMSIQNEYGDECMREALLPYRDIRIERVFFDGRQELFRVPSRDDERPTTLAEAQAQEARRVAALGHLDWMDIHTSGFNSSALTPAERSADLAHTERLRAKYQGTSHNNPVPVGGAAMPKRSITSGPPIAQERKQERSQSL